MGNVGAGLKPAPTMLSLFLPPREGNLFRISTEKPEETKKRM